MAARHTSAPVPPTGNFTLTVRRLERTLAGRDAWLLVANSGGMNVWCGAGGGHLTDHDVIAVIRASRIGELVAHRDLVLPQLSATGVQRRRVGEATGWRARWGPARLEDLPGFLDRGGRVTRSHRLMRFPLWERLEMSLMWAPPMALAAAVILGLLRSWRLGLVGAVVIALIVPAIFALLPGLRVVGRGRWLTYGGFAASITRGEPLSYEEGHALNTWLAEVPGADGLLDQHLPQPAFDRAAGGELHG
ncbi:MAG: hypothetical protein P8Y07_06810 [Gemmatimonadales bacterium]